jgi:hypothetical protein
MSLFGCVDPPPLFVSAVSPSGSSVASSKLRTVCAGRSSPVTCHRPWPCMTLHCCAVCYTISYASFHLLNCEEVLKMLDSWQGGVTFTSPAFLRHSCNGPPNMIIGERGHTPSRGAPCQYLVGRGPTREAEKCPTAHERSRRVAVERIEAEANLQSPG